MEPLFSLLSFLQENSLLGFCFVASFIVLVVLAFIVLKSEISIKNRFFEFHYPMLRENSLSSVPGKKDPI